MSQPASTRFRNVSCPGDSCFFGKRGPPPSAGELTRSRALMHGAPTPSTPGGAPPRFVLVQAPDLVAPRVTCSLLAAQVALSESLVAVRARDRERVDCYRVVFGTRRALPSSTGLSAVRGRRLTSPPGSCFVLVRAHCSRMEHSVPTLSHLLHPISLDGAGSVSARLHGPAPQVGVYGQEIN